MDFVLKYTEETFFTNGFASFRPFYDPFGSFTGRTENHFWYPGHKGLGGLLNLQMSQGLVRIIDPHEESLETPLGNKGILYILNKLL